MVRAAEAIRPIKVLVNKTIPLPRVGFISDLTVGRGLNIEVNDLQYHYLERR